MRILVIIALAAAQFTVVPFASSMALNTIQGHHGHAEMAGSHAGSANVTVVYKTHAANGA